MTVGVTVLGSTGSVGRNTLDVIGRHPDKFFIYALSAYHSVDIMLEQCIRFRPQCVVMVDPDAATQLAAKFKVAGLNTEVESGAAGLLDIASGAAETVVSGIVGAAGLMSVIAAVRSGKRLLIANKEPLVMLGKHIVELARENGACLLPLDSEHNAIFQCLPQGGLDEGCGVVQVSADQGIGRILLTGSGGPFRTLPLEQFQYITPEQACAHPNWDMGRKISVDSATMMNKGLELIEACTLFGVDPDVIEIVIHPQSTVHSMVEYIDGSVIAHLAVPDMRVPIANALAWPTRIESGANRLNFRDLVSLDFEAPQPVRFPVLRLAREAAKMAGTMPSVMNAANEVAVHAFLGGTLRFDKIAQMVESAMEHVPVAETVSLKQALSADQHTRQYCSELLAKWSH